MNNQICKPCLARPLREHLFDQRPIGGQFRAAECVTQQLAAQIPLELLLLSCQVTTQALQPVDSRAVAQLARRIDRLSVTIALAPAAERIVVLERKAERVDARVA